MIVVIDSFHSYCVWNRIFYL